MFLQDCTILPITYCFFLFYLVVPIEPNRGKESKVPEFCSEISDAVSDAVLAPEFASPGSTASTSGNWSRMRHMSGISVSNDDDTCSPTVDKLTPSLELGSGIESVPGPPLPNSWPIVPITQQSSNSCDRVRPRQWAQESNDCLKRSDSGGYYVRHEDGDPAGRYGQDETPNENICPPTPLYDTSVYKYPDISANQSNDRSSKDIQRCQMGGNMPFPMTNNRRQSWYDEAVEASNCRKPAMSMKTECEPPRLSHYPTPYPRSACEEKVHMRSDSTHVASPSLSRPNHLPLHLSSESSDQDSGYMGMPSPYTPFLANSPFFTPGETMTPFTPFRRSGDEVFNFRSPGPPSFRKNSEGEDDFEKQLNLCKYRIAPHYGPCIFESVPYLNSFMFF